MKSLGEIIRRMREEKGEPLRVLAAHLQIDQAIMSKIETGQRKPTREQVVKLAKFFGADEREMLIAWLSDRIVYTIEDESLAKEALKMAEEKVAYRRFTAQSRKSIISKIKKFLDRDGRVRKAWVFGSFARGDNTPSSDIDLMIEEDSDTKFSYFDLADIQHQLEQRIQRKVDIGFAKSLKAHAEPHIKKEAILIYEKS